MVAVGIDSSYRPRSGHASLFPPVAHADNGSHLLPLGVRGDYTEVENAFAAWRRTVTTLDHCSRQSLSSQAGIVRPHRCPTQSIIGYRGGGPRVAPPSSLGLAGLTPNWVS
jgi:hypothetical protein